MVQHYTSARVPESSEQGITYRSITALAKKLGDQICNRFALTGSDFTNIFPTELASVLKRVGNFELEIFGQDADVIKVFRFSKASNGGFCNSKIMSFLSRLRSGVECSARLGINFSK